MSSSSCPPPSRATSSYGCCCHRPLIASTSAPARIRGARLALTLRSSSLPLLTDPHSRSKSQGVACRAADEPAMATRRKKRLEMRLRASSFGSFSEKPPKELARPSVDTVVQADTNAETDSSADNEKKEAGDEALSAPVDSAVQADATAETDSSADNVTTILAFTVSEIQSEIEYQNHPSVNTYGTLIRKVYDHSFSSSSSGT